MLHKAVDCEKSLIATSLYSCFKIKVSTLDPKIPIALGLNCSQGLALDYI